MKKIKVITDKRHAGFVLLAFRPNPALQNFRYVQTVSKILKEESI